MRFVTEKHYLSHLITPIWFKYNSTDLHWCNVVQGCLRRMHVKGDTLCIEAKPLLLIKQIAMQYVCDFIPTHRLNCGAWKITSKCYAMSFGIAKVVRGRGEACPTCMLLNRVLIAFSSSSTLARTSPIMALSRMMASLADVWSSFTACESTGITLWETTHPTHDFFRKIFLSH